MWSGVKMKDLNGALSLFHENRAWSGLGVQRPFYPPHYEAFKRLGDAGLLHFQVDATCAEDIYHPELRFWKGPEEYDGSSQDLYFKEVIKDHPDALLALRVYVGAPSWWCERNIDECQVYADGSVKAELQRTAPRLLPSLASEKWKKEINSSLKKYIEWLKSTGWSKKIFAIFINYGITWEWGILGSNAMPDYSKPANKYFSRWLKNKYKSSEELSKAWGRDVTFDTVKVPSSEKRTMRGVSGLRDLITDMDVIDHQQSLSDMNSDLLISLGETARKEINDEVLLGAIYGYTLTARENTEYMGLYGAGGFIGGHHAMSKVLKTGLFDLYASPLNYANRDLNEGLFFEHVPLGTIQKNKCMFYIENDNYTYSNPPNLDSRQSVIDIGYTKNLQDTLRSLRLTWATTIARNEMMWLTELTGWVGPFNENFSSKEYIDECRQLEIDSTKIITKYDRTSTEEVAFIIDERSIAFLDYHNKDFEKEVYRAIVQWGHTGVPFTIYLLDDLDEDLLDKYKLIIPLFIINPKSIERLYSLDQSKATSTIVLNHNLKYAGKTDNEYRDSLIKLYVDYGVHRYVSDYSTVWSCRDILFINPGRVKKHTVRFRKGCTGYEYFSKRKFATQDCFLEWNYNEHGIGLFMVD